MRSALRCSPTRQLFPYCRNLPTGPSDRRQFRSRMAFRFAVGERPPQKEAALRVCSPIFTPPKPRLQADGNGLRRTDQVAVLPMRIRLSAGRSRTLADIDSGLPGGTRTPDPQLRRLVLYPVELRAARSALTGLRAGRGGGIRTRDLLVPNQLRYQAALRPERARLYAGGHDEGSSRGRSDVSDAGTGSRRTAPRAPRRCGWACAARPAPRRRAAPPGGRRCRRTRP